MTPAAPPAMARWLPWMGGAIVAGVLLWTGGMAADRLGLAERRASAVITAKQHVPPGRTHTTLIINNRPHAVPQVTGDQWLIGLAFAADDTAALAPVAEPLFRRLAEGQTVTVTYRRGRLFGGVEVIAVEP
jgi:hypothetical protein